MNYLQVWGWACLAILNATTFLQAQPPLGAQTSNLQSRPLYRSLQESLDLLSRAEIAREEATLLGKKSQELEPIRNQCRAAIKRLRSLESPLEQLLRKNYQLKPSQRDRNDWKLSELESLRRNLQVQLARAFRNQALCYAEDSEDRVNSLILALGQLAEVLTQPLDEADVWQARVEQVVCLRLAKRTAEARQQLDRWLQAAPPSRIAARLQGQRLRILLGERRFDQARQLADELQQSHADVPEADEAILATRLACGQMQRATQQLLHIAATHGPYWKRRAELQLGLAVAKQPATTDPHLLNLAATSLYAADRMDEAVAMYDRLAESTLEQDNQELHFQALVSAAAIVQAMEQPAAALQRFRQLALRDPQRAEASAHHLTAIGQSAELLRNAPPGDRGKRFEQYLALLREHLQLGPESPSAPQVQQWLSRSQVEEIKQQRAETLIAVGDRSQAIALYQQLVQARPTDGQLYEMYAKVLQQGQEEPELREALKVWRQVEQRSKPGTPRWWRGRRARLALLEQLGEGEQAEKLKQLTEILYPVGVNDE